MSSLREKQSAFLLMIAKLICFAKTSFNDDLVPLEYYRSIDVQRVLVARGASKTMASKHLDGLAMDLCFLADLKDDGKLNYPADKYKHLGEYWEKLGGRWGGRFGDNPATEKIEGWDAGHFEYAG